MIQTIVLVFYEGSGNYFWQRVASRRSRRCRTHRDRRRGACEGKSAACIGVAGAVKGKRVGGDGVADGHGLGDYAEDCQVVGGIVPRDVANFAVGGPIYECRIPGSGAAGNNCVARSDVLGHSGGGCLRDEGKGNGDGRR